VNEPETLAAIEILADQAVDIYDFFDVSIVASQDSERDVLDKLMCILEIVDMVESDRITEDYWKLFEWMNNHDADEEVPLHLEEMLGNVLYREVWTALDSIASPYGYKLFVDDDGIHVSFKPEHFYRTQNSDDDDAGGTEWPDLKDELC